jgi:quinoprotein glucose dehydrogenase
MALLAACGAAVAQQGAQNGEWRVNGGDLGSTRYSPLDQINRDNVKNLRVAWTWRSDNFGTRVESKSETTPLMIHGVVYFTAGDRRAVIAADAGTGETLWVWRLDEGARFDRGVRKNHRGVAYWSDGRQERVFTVTPGFELVALNPKTGQPVPGFGREGIVDLFKELGVNFDPLGTIGNTSPPVVSHDTVIVGPALPAGRAPRSYRNTKGDIMAFDARTGKKLWSFHTIPRAGEFGSETWLNGSAAYTGNAGLWTTFSVDQELGYVYLPVEGATGDIFGGHRPGANLFSSSLVCVDIKSGRRIWHYQLVHHDIWDYDPPAAPILVNLNLAGKPVKAVVQLTKQAFAFVFDRTTGQPLWPIEERAVPQTDAPGEWTSPTQPFPTRPPPFDRQGVTRDDLIDFTPELRQRALQAVEGFRLGSLFSPPSVADAARGTRGTFTLPGSGGANWEGGSADPETGYVYVGSATRLDTAVFSLIRPNPGQSDMNWIGGPGVLPNVSGLPVIKPPYGRITAFDMNRGEIAWQITNGDTPPAIRDHPMLKGVQIPRTGSPSRAATLVTRTLLFAGEGWGGQPMFRAYDKRTGAIVWETRIPAGAQTGPPITYLHKGRQFVVFSAGDPMMPAQIVAYALPAPAAPAPAGPRE